MTSSRVKSRHKHLRYIQVAVYGDCRFQCAALVWFSHLDPKRGLNLWDYLTLLN